MKAVTSVSGGKSSAYMALKYPADHYVFAVVLTDHVPSAPKDKGLLRECQNRIPHFVASHEADLTLVNMLRLEQELGKEIKWVAAEHTLDKFIFGTTNEPGYRVGKMMLPNSTKRFCTIRSKLFPLFWHCFLHLYDENPLLMNIGFRWDEPRRVEDYNCDQDKFKYPSSCSLANKRYSHKSVHWRIADFPLYRDRITNDDVVRFWRNKGWTFPEISNCRFCFHHRDVQQQRQAQLEPENVRWWLEMESKANSTFGKRPLAEILDQPLLNVFDDSLPCHCTD